MKQIFFSILLMLFVVGCTYNSRIEENEMKIIVWEISCVDELINHTHLKDQDTSKKYTAQRDSLYQKIFAMHNTTADKFYKTFSYYEENPIQFKLLLDSALAYGIRQRSNVIQTVKETIPTQPIQTTGTTTKDSLRKLTLKRNKALE
ncbi:MAG: DUF4296 domain-containing protein [Chitinophagaceae bacterium]|nr:DUF4296 domain-containing protein [Chitinophagaceae bacterium]HNE93028.1 DUF4296 domain-containing protein [Chitinophagaceae bacterium]